MGNSRVKMLIFLSFARLTVVTQKISLHIIVWFSKYVVTKEIMPKHSNIPETK